MTEKLAVVGKIYHHRIPGARFIMPNGQDISFAGGTFNTAHISDPEVRKLAEKELDKVADQASSMIYTKQPVSDMAAKQAASEVLVGATQAFDAENKIPAGTQTVAIPMAPQPVPVLNAANTGNAGAGEDGRTLQQKIDAAKELVASTAAKKTP